MGLNQLLGDLSALTSLTISLPPLQSSFMDSDFRNFDDVDFGLPRDDNERFGPDCDLGALQCTFWGLPTLIPSIGSSQYGYSNADAGSSPPILNSPLFPHPTLNSPTFKFPNFLTSKYEFPHLLPATFGFPLCLTS